MELRVESQNIANKMEYRFARFIRFGIDTLTINRPVSSRLTFAWRRVEL